MIVDIALLPTLERARRTGVLTPQEWADYPDQELQALLLHFSLHARKPHPIIASLATIGIYHKAERSILVGISVHSYAARILGVL